MEPEESAGESHVSLEGKSSQDRGASPLEPGALENQQGPGVGGGHRWGHGTRGEVQRPLGARSLGPHSQCADLEGVI